MFSQPYPLTTGCKVTLKLDKVAQKDENGFQIHKAVLVASANGLSVYNTSANTEFEQTRIKDSTAPNEAYLEFGLSTMGLFKLFVTLNDRPFKEIFFIESRKSKLQGVEEQLSTMQQSNVSIDPNFNNSKTSAFIKRPKSSFRLSSNVLLKKHDLIVLKIGSTQSVKKPEVVLDEQKRTSIKDIIISNKGKLEKYLKGKNTILPSIKRAV